MLREERENKILGLLNDKTYVSVQKLSELLYVSKPTIRRDLSNMESKGLIVRSHGGAMSLSAGKYEIPLGFRDGYKVREKQEMCKKAASLVRDGDTIFIDASTSVMFMAEYINVKHLTVVTNGMRIACDLAEKGFDTYFVGGKVSKSSFGTAGIYAEKFVSMFNYNHAFFSAHGINDKNMIVDTSMEETALRREVFKTTQNKVFLYEKSKIGLSAPYNVVDFDEVETVITHE